MSEEFSKIANQVMVTRSADFNKQTEDKLRMLLSPLKENIDRFEKKIDETRTLQLRESTSLKEQITQLSGLNQQMSQEAKNLTLALKGESKTRGTWGEMILESILDKSGLIKNDHYTVQQTLKDQEGRTLRPDVIVNLPENKHLVIDSKIALVDYENYVNSSGEAEAARFIKAHIAALRRHVGELSNKNYQTLYGITPPDFVLMFVPIEPAFNAALENDQDIWNYALSRNVLMLTPSTLVATLKIIYSIWRQESQNRNAVAIAETGGKLYDKFVGFIEDLSEIGRGIEKTQKCYDEAMKKLSTGRGNLVGMTEKMRELGAKATKSLPVSSDDAGE
jgi:DNA recombination protein RmuC